MALGLKGAELRAAIAKLRSFLGAGDTDDEAAAKLGLSWAEYEDLKRAMYAAEVEVLRKRSTAEAYIDYVLAQQQNINDLNAMVSQFKETKQYNAMVGAIRARSEMVDKILERGQEFGLIAKSESGEGIVAGVAVGNLTNEQLKARIAREIEKLSDVVARYGSGSMKDLPVGPIYRDAEPAPEVKAKAREPEAKRTKVRAGRRVVKKVKAR